MGVVIPYYSQIEVNLMITKFFNRLEMTEYFEIKTNLVVDWQNVSQCLRYESCLPSNVSVFLMLLVNAG